MLGIVVLAVCLVVAGAFAGVDGPYLTAAPANVDLEPLPTVARGALRGVSVGIVPVTTPVAGGRAVSAVLAQLTANDLVGFVEHAGGSAVVSHRDLTLVQADGAAALSRDVAPMHAANCSAVLEIGYGQPSAAALSLADASPATRDLCVALHAALPSAQLEPVAAEAAADDGAAGTDVPRVRISLPADAAGPVDATRRRACLNDAWRLYQALSWSIGSRCIAAQDTDKADSGGADSGADSPAAQLARRVWPGQVPADQAGWFVQSLVRGALSNPTLTYCAAQLDAAVPPALSIRTNVPALAGGLRAALHDAGVVVTRVDAVALPDRAALGEQPCGICRAPMALTYQQLPGRVGVQTQLRWGEALYLLDRSDDDVLVLASDGYWGWVNAAAVQPITQTEFETYVALPVGRLKTDTIVDGLIVPRGAPLRIRTQRGDLIVAVRPGGGELELPASDVTLRAATARDADRRVEAALDLLYTPYVFGGRSSLGLDCSGFVAYTAEALGERPARDAWQQALAGELVATAWHRTRIRAGDQLFFINRLGKVFHTALALDTTRCVHASPPCVQISSLDPADPLYDAGLAETFFIAKRP